MGQDEVARLITPDSNGIIPLPDVIPTALSFRLDLAPARNGEGIRRKRSPVAEAVTGRAAHAEDRCHASETQVPNTGRCTAG